MSKRWMRATMTRRSALQARLPLGATMTRRRCKCSGASSLRRSTTGPRSTGPSTPAASWASCRRAVRARRSSSSSSSPSPSRWSSRSSPRVSSCTGMPTCAADGTCSTLSWSSPAGSSSSPAAQTSPCSAPSSPCAVSSAYASCACSCSASSRPCPRSEASPSSLSSSAPRSASSVRSSSWDRLATRATTASGATGKATLASVARWRARATSAGPCARATRTISDCSTSPKRGATPTAAAAGPSSPRATVTPRATACATAGAPRSAT
mmetsp:Transcript_48654/g.117096  ORF Transcript_48654/g.117096 Transcript_48654/m.117096 type:complete len:267 (+) Transcript_48654:17-817(+)